MILEILFQFLIGRLGTIDNLEKGLRAIEVSIPHR